jgi:hypothetical protein
MFVFLPRRDAWATIFSLELKSLTWTVKNPCAMQLTTVNKRTSAIFIAVQDECGCVAANALLAKQEYDTMMRHQQGASQSF